MFTLQGMRGNVEPVSYTHLDVYKRQLLCYAVRATSKAAYIGLPYQIPF